jgi:hypothetical protein
MNFSTSDLANIFLPAHNIIKRLSARLEEKQIPSQEIQELEKVLKELTSLGKGSKVQPSPDANCKINELSTMIQQIQEALAVADAMRHQVLVEMEKLNQGRSMQKAYQTHSRISE